MLIWKKFHMWKMNIDPRDAAKVILERPLAAPTGTTVIYSCMGYILLGRILEKICGEPLDKIVQRLVLDPLGMKDTCYCPAEGRVCVSTEKEKTSDDYICGHVHDENAHSIGGVSGNAGLFSTLDDCIQFAALLSRRHRKNTAGISPLRSARCGSNYGKRDHSRACRKGE